jgi:hypothetical protein
MSTIPAGTTAISDLDDAWRVTGHGPRLRAVRDAAERVRARLVSGPHVVSVRTLPLGTLPYPTKYAFNGCARSLAPFVSLTHRCVLVQFLQRGARKTLLFNPTDVVAGRATPYFARLKARVPDRIEPLLAKRFDPLEKQLAALGLTPEDIDYVAFDHFHSQDMRTLLGTVDGVHPPRFPNATLLAPENEWADWDDLHPMQRAWFVRDGKLGARTDRVELTARDLALGDGVMLLRTPGHTSGNQTLFLSTPDGVWGISECGTCADNWSPLDSKISGLAASCKRTDVDVVINANSPELGATQYTSMVLERTIVDRVRHAPAFVQMFSSSEVTPSVLAPGLSPTLLHREITVGKVVRPRDSAGTRPQAEAALTTWP